MVSPAVSVIINCLNGEQYLREAIDSVLSQTFQDWEVIVWDNASTDKTAEIAESYGGRVRVFRGAETVPLGQARNLAANESCGDYVAFLDCDDIWMPEKLEKQVALFEQNPKVGLVYCDATNFSSRGTLNRIHEYITPRRGNAFRELYRHYFLAMSAVIVKRSAVEKVGGWFDERFHACEEAELFLRIAKEYEIDYVDEVLTKRRLHESNASYSLMGAIAKENGLILCKFKAIYADFEQEYSVEIAAIQKKILFQTSIELWRTGDPRGARSMLRGYLKEKKFLLFFFATFLPRRLFPTLFRLYLRLSPALS